ncbi:hypothetical protein [Staphylococcus delphini]|uniref:Phage protein n=1 Tax=Staphylococcus delphini TaxID=53344 RepID=A0AAX0QT49_9STAP|nr:hypothetical protein [Staphylococcus delphini]PCF50091.1 hypothetical protein B5C07_07745 [Staphylococcus delphini]PNZ95712.1 hypothetical protein CD148_03285 [Staphylococcus delphini]RIZ56277.1 hypothetical protein CDL68_01680 [Staphylococcus delphini]VED62509.1 Uncharacterised protein [Staphylococcus delphini]
MFIIEYTSYFPNNESYSLDDYYFVEKEEAIEYLKNDGFKMERHDIYKKGEMFGTRANITQLAKFK